MKKAVPILCVILVLAAIPLVVSDEGPDLKVTEIVTISDLNTGTTKVTATVKNRGDTSTVTLESPTGRFNIELNVTSAGVGAGSSRQSVTRRRGPLAPGETIKVTATFTGTDWDNSHVIADVDNEIPETNENNNSMGDCNWVYIIDFGTRAEITIDVGNITYDPAEIELVIDNVSSGMTVTLDTSVVYLDVGEVTQVTLYVTFGSGFTEGEVVILGIYSDGYTVSPATIGFVDTNP
jgi:hypothetical protein